MFDKKKYLEEFVTGIFPHEYEGAHLKMEHAWKCAWELMEDILKKCDEFYAQHGYYPVPAIEFAEDVALWRQIGATTRWVRMFFPKNVINLD